MEQVKEWLQRVEVGGKELMQSLEAASSLLHSMKSWFIMYVLYSYDVREFAEQVLKALEATAETVNLARTKKDIDIHIALFL